MEAFRERWANLSRTERLIIAVIAGFFLLTCCSTVARRASSVREEVFVEEFVPAATSPVEAVEPAESPFAAQTVTTAKGTFSIPGTAILDGRDPEASEVVTIRSINVWDGVPHHRVVCKLDHGAQVDLLATRWSEEESHTYFQVRSGVCEGWVSEAFVSPEEREPAADSSG